MRYLLTLFALAGAATAFIGCQPATSTSPPTAAAPPKPATPSAVALPVADSTAAMLALTRQVDLAPLWGGKTEHSFGEPMEGFYGPDHYRISFYFDAVRRDPARPNVFMVRGRDRYKKAITPFMGTITVTRLASPLPDTVSLEHSATLRTYSAFASFELREDPDTKGAGWCQGRAVLDFTVDAQQQVELPSYGDMDAGEGNPTGGGGLVFRGTWHDNRTGQRKAIAWANDFRVVMPNVLSEMGLGSRGDEVDPRLARYGWDTYYDNDEWWHEVPKPSL